jgi:hypothetical protein
MRILVVGATGTIWRAVVAADSLTRVAELVSFGHAIRPDRVLLEFAPMPQAYGHDPISAGGPDRWVLECPRPKAWTARTPGTRTSREHPGTAVR